MPGIGTRDKMVSKSTYGPCPEKKKNRDGSSNHKPAKSVTVQITTKQRYTRKWEPEGQELMIWRLIRAGFPERVTKDPVTWSRYNQAKQGRQSLPAENSVCGWGCGGPGPGRRRKGTKAGVSGRRERGRNRQTDRHREGGGGVGIADGHPTSNGNLWSVFSSNATSRALRGRPGLGFGHVTLEMPVSKSEVSGRSQLCSGLLLRNFFPGVSSWSVIREEGALQAITRFLGFNSSTVANAKLTALTKWGGPILWGRNPVSEQNSRPSRCDPL